MNTSRVSVSASIVAGLLAAAAGAAVNMETVPVGDPGNAGEWSGQSYSYAAVVGGVTYPYRIGKYEVTAAQYTEFLNAVAKTDTYGLYNAHMDTAVDAYGCNIRRTGTFGNYTYSVSSDWANRPVNYVSWGDSTRFANWLHNGQPAGSQNQYTTEDGTYFLNSATTSSQLLAVNRKADWRWTIATEDEWYKAAYYKGGSTNAGYWNYPTGSDADPGQDMADVSGNNANYWTIPYIYPIDSGKYTTIVGQFENSDSPYGTFDQGGNVWEWNETSFGGSSGTTSGRLARGGSYGDGPDYLHASFRNVIDPTYEGEAVGFRVVLILNSGDFDFDGDVDSADFALFAACRSGPAVPYADGCGDKDLDGDGDVDQDDFGIFQRRLAPLPPPGVLLVVESEDFVSSGFQGGPFTPASKTYTLTNTGGLPIAWTAESTHPWTTLSKMGGTLTGGASDTVEVSINAGATNLADGSYGDTLTFTNTTNHSGDMIRAVNLTVNAVPPIPPGMVFIPPGSFQMGDSFTDGNADELPVHPVTLSAFFVDRYMVTNQQYAAALNWALAQGGLITVSSGAVYQYNSSTNYPYCYLTPNYSSSRISYNTSTSTFGSTSGKENHPMVNVTWYGAVAYANWRSAMEGLPLCYDLSTWNCNLGNGYRLPTEAEWEKAARGGMAGHRFPWSDTETIQQTRANYLASRDELYDTNFFRGYHPSFSGGNFPYTSPVGYFAANDYGLYDMAGNVFEWCNDWYDYNYYGVSQSVNPSGPATGTYRVLRGGSWAGGASGLRCAYRAADSPEARSDGFGYGFRLVMDAP